MAYLEIRELTKDFQERRVLNGIDLAIEQGEFVTFLGPSGCGKSTLLRCVSGLEKHATGDIYLDSECITDKAPSERGMGMIFQQYHLFPNMTVFNNIAFGLKLRKTAKETIRQEVDALLNLIKLSGMADKYPSQLSGGEQQRVALARSLAVKPKVMLYDEPLSAIDANLRKELQSSIKDIHQSLQMTSIFVTHDQEEALSLSDRICLLEDGKIVQIGTGIELYEQPVSRYVARFFGDHNNLSQEEGRRIFNIAFSRPWLALKPEAILLTKPSERTACLSFMARLEKIIPHINYTQLVIVTKGVSLTVTVSRAEGALLTRKATQQWWVRKKDIIELER